MTTEVKPLPAVPGHGATTARVDALTLVAGHAAVLLAAARALVMNEAEAQDLVQTTMEIALRRIDQIRDVSAIRAWLLAIETREALRLVRRLRRLVALDATVHDVPMGGGHETDHLAVCIALGHLPPRTRAAVVLHHLVGLSVEETASAMGTSSNTVKTQVRDGFRRLRKELTDG